MDTPEEPNQTRPLEPAPTPLSHQSLTGGPVFQPQAPPAEVGTASTEESTTPAVEDAPAPSVDNPASRSDTAPPSLPAADPSTAIGDNSQAVSNTNTNIVQNQPAASENEPVKVVDTAAQTTPKSAIPAPLAAPPPPSLSAAASPQPTAAAAPPPAAPPPALKTAPAAKRSSLVIAIIAAILLVIVGIGGLIFFAKKNTGSAQWFGNPAKKQADQNLNDSAGGQITNLPAGYEVVSRSCFQLGLPPNSTVSAERGCLLLAKNSPPQYLNLAVTPSTEKNGGLAALSTAAQKNYDANLLKLAAMSDTTIGGSSAKKLIFTTSGDINQVKILVIPPQPNYLQENTPITSFEISYSYKSDEEKARAESVLSTWSWK